MRDEETMEGIRQKIRQIAQPNLTESQTNRSSGVVGVVTFLDTHRQFLYTSANTST